MSVVGVVGDLHLPFTHSQYLRFVKDTFAHWRVNKVVFIGDIVDAHALGFWDHDPNGQSAEDESARAAAALAAWRKTFPAALVCIGNHDARHFRVAKKAGLPDRFLRGYADVWDTRRWKWDFSHTVDGVRYEHGTGASGKNAAVNLAIKRRGSVVVGHTHTFAGPQFHTNDSSRIFGMGVGCVSADTEYFSPQGWRRIDEYCGGAVMQYNAAGRGDWVLPSRYVVLPCDELNYIHHGYGLSQQFCDDHKVVYCPSSSRKLLKAAGWQIVERHNSAKTRFQGRFPVTFESAGGGGLALTPEEVRVQVAFHADGTLRPNDGAVLVRKQRKKDRLAALLAAAGIPFERWEYGPDSRFVFNPPCRTQSFGAEWYRCSRPQLDVVVDEVLRWDGNQTNVYDSKHPSDCDFVQYAFAGTGRRASIVPGHGTTRVIVSETRDLVTMQEGPIERVPASDGKRYCFTVPSGMLVLRHNKRVFITGNCGIDCRAYAFSYGRDFPDRPVLGCGIVVNGTQPFFIAMPCGPGEKYRRKQ